MRLLKQPMLMLLLSYFLPIKSDNYGVRVVFYASVFTSILYLSGCASTEVQEPAPVQSEEQLLIEEQQRIIEGQQKTIEELELLLAEKNAKIKQKHIREKEQDQVIQATSHEITRTQKKLHRLATRSSSASLISEAEVAMAAINQKAVDPSDKGLTMQAQRLLDTAILHFSKSDYASATQYASQAVEFTNMVSNTINGHQSGRAIIAFNTPIMLKTTTTVNLRLAPGSDSGVVDVLEKGTELTAGAYQGNWLRVQTDKNVQGWIFNTFIEVAEDIDSIF